jgi:hypothetical protein
MAPATSFCSGFDRGVSALAIQPDGKIIASGYVWANGYEHHGYIVRLNEDGSADPSFGGVAGEVGLIGFRSAASEGAPRAGGWEDSRGRILCRFLEDLAAIRLAVCLNADGSRDTDFSTSLGEWRGRY